MDSTLPGFRTEPTAGRVYSTRRIVRSTDVTSSGRVRLDALARYLQTVAEDDVVDSGLAEPVVWLVRRCELRIATLPAMGERVVVRTFCSGTGPRWAERTTTLVSLDGHPLAQATAVWAAISRTDGRPAPLSAEFAAIYGPSAAGRIATARLSHPRPDVPKLRSSAQAAAETKYRYAPRAGVVRDWPLRAADFDAAGHVNNTVHWQVVEDELATAGWLPSVAEIEYQRAIMPDCVPRLVTDHDENRTMLWLLDGERVLASARLLK